MRRSPRRPHPCEGWALPLGHLALFAQFPRVAEADEFAVLFIPEVDAEGFVPFGSVIDTFQAAARFKPDAVDDPLIPTRRPVPTGPEIVLESFGKV